MKKQFFLVFMYIFFNTYSEKTIFLKVTRKEIKNEIGKIVIKDSNIERGDILVSEEFFLHENGEIIKKYYFVDKKDKDINYLVGKYNIDILEELLENILIQDMKKIDDIDVCLSKCVVLDDSIFSNVTLPTEYKRLNIVINGEIQYGINSIYEINYKENNFILVNASYLYESENIKRLLKFFDENLRVNVLWDSNFKEKI